MTYGCHNRPPLKDTIRVQTLVPATPVYGQAPAYSIGFKDIPNVNSKDCRYDLRTTDPKCAGCKWIATPQLKQEAT